jgi:hypothetical protein
MSRFAKPSDYAGNSFFKPAEHMTDLAILVEPKSIERGVPSTYNGNTRMRDEVLADISVFSDQGALDKGEPSKVMKNCKVVHGMLTSTLEKILGGATVAIVTKIPTEKGEGFVFRDVDSDTENKVGAFFDAREAEVAAALEAVPDFED